MRWFVGHVWFVWSCLHAPLPALPIYEYLVTLDREHVAVWKRKVNATSLLLLSVRWGMVALAIISAPPATAKVRLHH